MMRTEAVRDQWGFQRARCLAHENCRAAGRMVEPSGRELDLFSQGREIWHLNENFKRHLQRRDRADGTSLALLWKVSDRIHGPKAPFPTPYGSVAPLPFCQNVEPTESDGTETETVDPVVTADGVPAASEMAGDATCESEDSNLGGRKRARVV